MKVNNDIFFVSVAENLKEGKNVKIILKGTSMIPALKEGDEIVIEPIVNELMVNNVVLFKYSGTYILHRIVAINGDNYTLQGDNCYTKEYVKRQDILAVLTTVNGSINWDKHRHYNLAKKNIRNFAIRWLGRKGRKQLLPWYFICITILMWAPLNGLGVPLDNFVLGIRLDHLLHASVFIPCTFFLLDIKNWHRWRKWILAIIISLTYESVQYILPYRGFDVNDMIANILGVTLGWVIILIYEKRTNRQ